MFPQRATEAWAKRRCKFLGNLIGFGGGFADSRHWREPDSGLEKQQAYVTYVHTQEASLHLGWHRRLVRARMFIPYIRPDVRGKSKNPSPPSGPWSKPGRTRTACLCLLRKEWAVVCTFTVLWNARWRCSTTLVFGDLTGWSSRSGLASADSYSVFWTGCFG